MFDNYKSFDFVPYLKPQMFLDKHRNINNSRSEKVESEWQILIEG